ncbi:hypothetical protein HRM2_18070 [Desulforapulum autotrophicum HRM2]|uniref:Uncharacterized protein n=1 Tax=Desulforapulum autotrophicum (strain ATCC 43914 / DSM 3382 / VKM B-1955 / HRM2) TaxID=177437 RepID=C0QBP7_DESAH|nr:hypothetical protein HRM2_18070 [Desulforapulum autotrophicum HRM2]
MAFFLLTGMYLHFTLLLPVHDFFRHGFLIDFSLCHNNKAILMPSHIKLFPRAKQKKKRQNPDTGKLKFMTACQA